MPVKIPKLPLTSKSIPEEQKEKLRQLFPEVFTEGKIDWERLQLTLGADVETVKERFGLTWRGKAECFRIIQEPSIGTLKPVKDESVDWDTTENLFIEGDNLETLKLLQKSYYGKVKMIYIDPPYNTGKEFIYPDKYSESLDTYLLYTGQVDAEGRKFSTNPETAGRYHSNWLDMMYPRLFLARNLLRDDGVIFISIDDHEVHNLREMMNEIFGEENFIAILIWEKGRKNDARLFSVGHEYIVVFCKSMAKLRELNTLWREEKPGSTEIWSEYVTLRKKFQDNDKAIENELKKWFKDLPKNHPSKKLSRYHRVDKNGPWRDRDISWPGGGGPRYEVIHPITKLPCKVPERGWGFASPEEMMRQIALGLIVFRDDETQPPFRKAHLHPIPDELDPVEDSITYDDETEDDLLARQVMPSYIYKQSQVAVKYLRKLFGAKLFDNPKDHEVLIRLIQYITNRSENDIILDFFAGSCTTAHAVLELNQGDNGNRHFIMVQLPEPTAEDSEAFKAGYKNIANIGKERIRRVITKIKTEQEQPAEQKTLLDEPKNLEDLGFRVFKLGTSNFTVWDGIVPANGKVEKQIELFIDHIDPHSTDEEILYELLLKSGFALTTPVAEKKIAGKKVYSIDDNALLICLEHDLTKDLIVKMAEIKPARAICLDTGFKNNDQLRTNAMEIMKSHGIADFRTV